MTRDSTGGAAKVALAAGAVAGFAAVAYGGVGTVLVSRSNVAHNVGQLAATKEALQSRLAALQQEHHVLEERHGEAKKAHAMAIKRGGLGGELNDWTNKEVDEAKKNGKSWVAKEVVEFMKYEKNNPYFDKSANFYLQDDQDEDGDDAAESSDSSTTAKSKAQVDGEKGGDDEKQAKKAPKVDAIVTLDRDFAKYGEAWKQVKTVHPHFGVRKTAAAVDAALEGQMAARRRAVAESLREDLGSAIGDAEGQLQHSLKRALSHPMEFDLPSNFGFGSEGGKKKNSNDGKANQEAAKGR